MNDDFQKRIRAASVAAWWVVLLGFVSLVAGLAIYRGIMSAEPDWILTLWGNELTWQFYGSLSLSALVAWKIVVVSMALVALWLTLWARQLR